MAPSEEERKLFPRWSAYGLINGSNPTQTRRSPQNVVQGPEETPTSIPSPVFKPVSVVPVEELPAQTTHAPVPQYPGSGTILNGYCETPAYTILDGPTALWVPVVGCISSKSDCCPTSTAGSGAAPTGNQNPEGKNPAGNGEAFPISSFPAQGTLTGCPADYHTVDKTACCPSSYWLWTSNFGGQIPCYSALNAEMTPPPMPDTLAQDTSGSTTAATASAKPTSAIVNIAYAMQYPMVPRQDQPALKKPAKIGIGVGVGSAAVIIGVLLWFLIRKFTSHRGVKSRLRDASVSQRFGEGIDTSYVAHHAAPSPTPREMAHRAYEGTKYSQASTQATGARY
ncbi:hypothetical protein CC78DRAFT_589860 [Lojkania enalia]|uniref:Uncharacterized protein n=1 Tax=Lojkania enalia TaxID=147567 RepID=A0A9P4N0C6_9PLEO|nr:hypothetical protein CC78DRAFT_589860 [Didymosphaeria enalia]